MIRLLKKLQKFTIPEAVNEATPTLRIIRNDPNKPRVRNSGRVARLRKMPPIIP